MASGSNDSRVREQAFDWLLQVASAPEDKGLKRRVEEWLNAAPSHRAAWEDAQRTWSALGDVPHDQRYETRSHRSVKPPKRFSGAAAMAALAACAILAFGPGLAIRLQADFMAERGAVRQVQLPDGSVAWLAPDSAIDFNFRDNRRLLRLLSGDAFFDVRHDPNRPFVVRSGSAEITVLGTAFEVKFAGAETQVSVMRGRVAVSDGAMRKVLAAGDTVAAGHGKGRKTEIAVNAIAAWREGRLFVQDQTVRDIAAQLSPYTKGWVLVTDSKLGGRRITGSYDLTDPHSALDALAKAAGGQIHTFSPFVTVISPVS